MLDPVLPYQNVVVVPNRTAPLADTKNPHARATGAAISDATSTITTTVRMRFILVSSHSVPLRRIHLTKRFPGFTPASSGWRPRR